MNKTIKTLGSILFTGLFAAGVGASAFGPGTFGGVKTAAEGESAHQITLKLNGGERLVDDARSGADVSYSLNGDTLKLTHDNVRAMFGNAAPYKYEGDSYLSDATDPKGQKIFATPLLYGLFVDTDNDGTLDEGERLYCSGDTLKVTADTVLTCYYSDNGFVYSQANAFGDVQDYQVCFAKAWKDGNAPVHESGESRSYTARQLQPLYHMITAIGDLAFSTNGWCNVIKSIEIPTTVQQIGMGAFKFAFQCTSITGLTRVHTFGPEALFMAGAAEINLGDNLHHFGHYSFTLEARSSRLIVEAWQNDEAKWYADGRLEDNPTPWFGVAGPTVSAPNAYVYVPKGKTSEWYKTAHAQLKLANGSNWTGEGDDNLTQYANSFNIPMREMYTVRFDLNGADGYIANQHQDAGAVSVKDGEKELNLTSFDASGETQLTATNEADADLSMMSVAKPADPTMEGKLFLGWKDSKGDIWQDSDFGANGKVLTADETLTAQWADPATLTLKLNNGEEDVVSTVADGSYLSESNIDEPLRDGYWFGGWYKEAACTNEWRFDADTIDGDTVLYAKWNADEYTISYELNGGTAGADAPVKYTVEDEVTLVAPAKEGYEFGGWYADAACTGEAVTKITQGSTGNKTFYAKWTATEYTISYELNGGTAGADAPATYTTEAAVTLVAPTKEGYTFKGWYAAQDFTGEPVTEVAAGSKGNKTFYAKWEKNAEENSSGNSSGNSSSGSSSEKESTETTAGCNSSMIGGTLGGAAILSCVLAFTKKRRSNKK